MFGRLTQKQYDGLKVGDQVLLVAGQDLHRVVALATIVDEPSESVLVRVTQVLFKGTEALGNVEQQLVAGRAELYHKDTLICGECRGRGKSRYGREGQGFDEECRTCHGKGVVP